MHFDDKIEALRRLPWYSIEQPADVLSGRGMIGDDERRLLYTLTKDYFSDSGRIIDGGAYLGSSSLALGLGLKHRNFPKRKVIDAFDMFIMQEIFVHNYLDRSDPLSQNVKPGDYVRHIYDRNTAEVAEYITVHDGDVRAKPWNGDPIEILFCDISKTPETNDYIIENWIPALLPEIGVLIQQDQVEENHVWVTITMEMLIDYFEFIDYTANCSMVYRLKREIPSSILERCLQKNITHQDREFYYKSFLDRFRRVGMGRFSGWRLGMVELGLAVLYGRYMGDVEKAEYTLKQIEAQFSQIPDTMYRLTKIRRLLSPPRDSMEDMIRKNLITIKKAVDLFEGSPVIGCGLIGSSINFTFRGNMGHCCGFDNKYDITKICDFNGGPFPFDAYILSYKLFTLQNMLGHGGCEGCPQLSLIYPPHEFEFFRSISLNHYWACNLKCSFCVERSRTGERKTYNIVPVFQELYDKGYMREETIVCWGGRGANFV